MADNLPGRLSSDGFDPKSYVKELTLQCMGVDELLSTREQILKLSDETNAMLKKNVYKNYTQFIDTAKEITYLESEMYQLSHMLTEQQDVLNSILEVNIASGKSSSPSETDGKGEDGHSDNHINLSLLLEKVEGCAVVLEEKKRSVVYYGELIELGLIDHRILAKVYCVLLTDGFIVAAKCDRRRGPVQYQFQVMYDLDNLALVNVKDDANIKNAFKILVFPDSRMFQASSPSLKSEWLSMIEQTKQNKMSCFLRQLSLSDSKNPFGDDSYDDLSPFDDDVSFERELDFELPTWLIELPEDLDVCITQREFEEAVNLIQKANEYLASHPKITKSKEMRAKIDIRVKHLIENLKNELKVTPERSLHAGPRAARSAVSVLLRLGKSPVACSLFLKQRSALLKQSLKQQTMGSTTAPYIEKLCSVFFLGIIEAGQQFNKAFANNNSCASAFVVWAKTELQHFIQLFSRHVFTPQVTASVSANCISYARAHCAQLPEIGLDFSFELNSLLQVYVERLVTEIRDKLLEAIKLRASDDKWRPQNFQNAMNLRKFIDDMKELGFEDIESYVYDTYWVALTANTVAFGKMYLNFVDDLLKLYTSSVHGLIKDALVTSFQAQTLHVLNAYQKSNDIVEQQFISKNGQFLSESVLPLAGKHYMQKLGLMFPGLAELRAELSKFSSVSKTSVSKYSPTVYV